MDHRRLLIISSEFPPGPGGIGTHAFHMASQMVKHDWDVRVLTPQINASPHEVASFNQQQPFKVLTQSRSSIRFVTAYFFFKRWLQEVKKYKPHLIVATGSREVGITALLNQIIQIPWTAVVHGGAEFGSRQWWKQRFNRWAYTKADLVICVSEYTQKQMLETGIRPRRSTVIHNGADEVVFRELPNESIQNLKIKLNLDQPDNRFLLTVGSVTDRKGQGIVIRALPEILKIHSHIHYLMVGMPVIREELTQLAKELGVMDHVHFLGRIDTDTLVAAYNLCDIFLMTSRHSEDGDFEGYGIAVLEAALCGKPSIVSSESGLAEAVDHEKTGIHVPEDDPQSVAQAVLELINTPVKLHKLGQEAKVQAIQKKTWSRRMDAYNALFCDLI